MRKTLQVITAVATLAVATPLPAAGLPTPPASPGTASPTITRPGPAARTGSALPVATPPRGAGIPAPATVASSPASGAATTREPPGNLPGTATATPRAAAVRPSGSANTSLAGPPGRASTDN